MDPCEYCHSPEQICTTRFTADGKEILGTTPIGRTTSDRLDLNDTRYPEEESIRSARELWKRVGLHPPNTDPCQSA